MVGAALVSGPGQACLDALRCAAFLGQQHPQDLKQAILLHTMASPSRTTTEGGGQAGGLRWLEALVSLLQGVVGEAGARAGSRRRRRKKRRRRELGVENEQGQAGEEEEQWEEEATEEEEEEGAEASGGAWLGEGPAGGQRTADQQLQHQIDSRLRPEERGGMEVDPAASVSAPARPRADLVISSGSSSSSSSSSRRGGVVRRTAVGEALGSGDVVGSIFSFLVGVGEASTGRQSVRQLGQLGLVCRKWREVSLREAWWDDAVEEMLPWAVWWRREGTKGSRRDMLEHGRMLLCERRVWVGEHEWARGLSIAFEVFDRMDGLQMLSVRGWLGLRIDEDSGEIVLAIGRGPRVEVVGRPFSAASRDPEQRRFQSMRDFFERGHEAGFASLVCARVSVTDERTGRQALLWEEGGQVQRRVLDAPPFWQAFVGEQGFAVKPLQAQPVTCPVYCGPQLYGAVEFFVSSVVGQAEGVSEQERLYQLAGGDGENYGEHESFVSMALTRGDPDDESTPPVDMGTVGRFVRSVLGQG